jgi:hypothetical protein
LGLPRPAPSGLKEEEDGTLRVDIDLHAGQGRVGDLMAESNFVLSIVVIPGVEPTVSSGDEEESGSGGGPATIGQVSVVITGSDDESFGIIVPDLD